MFCEWPEVSSLLSWLQTEIDVKSSKEGFIHVCCFNFPWAREGLTKKKRYK